jgi:hypothetical protein
MVFRLTSGEREALITNLWEDEMEEGVFPELYYKRWPLGPKYNQVKQKMELENFSGRLADNIKQDFYAMMTVPDMPAGGLREANENIILRMYERGAAEGMTEQYILEMRSVNKSFFGTRLRPGARVCYMMGPIGVSPQIFRKQGIEESLFKDTAMNIQVLEEQTANWRRIRPCPLPKIGLQSTITTLTLSFVRTMIWLWAPLRQPKPKE